MVKKGKKNSRNLFIGKRGEKIAVAFLKKQGYKIIETNIYYHWGEIDIVAKDKDCLVFIEVKTRTGRKYGFPEESINFPKLQSLKKAAEYYLTNNNLDLESFRIDIVSIILNNNNLQPEEIKIFRNITEK